MIAAEIQANLSDRKWRINNLYYVKDENGNKVLFKLNKVQEVLFDNLWFFNIVPKARQLGITTFFAILYLDQVLWNPDKTAGIIAHRQEDMKKIFRNKIKYAWDNIHPYIRQRLGEPNIDSAYEMTFNNESTIFVSMTTRSGTVQFLHISEFGYICAKAPEKAEEIVTGAINSVHKGNMVSIESTSAGQEGYFFDYCMIAEKMRKENRELTEFDFKIFFFPWYIDPRYELDAKFALTQDLIDYFKKLEDRYKIKLNDGQKRWYQKKRALMKEKMFQEYPSTLDEAFQVSVEGSYFSKEMNKVYQQNRILPVPHESMLEVDTWWDLGMNDFNVILFTQTIGSQIRFIDMYWNSGEGLKHYYDILKERKEKYDYRYRIHTLPFDAEVRELGTGISRRQTLSELGMKNIRVAPKSGDKSGDIDRARTVFSKFVFDEVKCKKLHEALFNYRKDFDKKLGVFRDSPRHDESSHFADAMLGLAKMWREEMPAGSENEGDNDQSYF